MKGESCFTDLVSEHGKVAHLAEGKCWGCCLLDFNKAFDTVPHRVLLEKLSAHGLDVCVLLWGVTVTKDLW